MPARRAAILLLGLAAAAGASAKFEQYVPRTLQSVIDANRSFFDDPKTPDLLFTGSNFPTRARVVYDGKIQPIPGSRLEFLSHYFRSRNHPEWFEQFKEEILCHEGDSTYWLPIQASVLEYFKKEIAAGGNVELYVTWVGAIKSGSEVDWIFTVNEFQAIAIPAPRDLIPVSWTVGTGVGDFKISARYESTECRARFALESAQHTLVTGSKGKKPFLTLRFRKQFQGDFNRLPLVTIVQGKDRVTFPAREKSQAAPVADWSTEGIEVVIAASTERMSLRDPSAWSEIQVSCKE